MKESLAALLSSVCAEYPNKIAIVAKNQEYTYHQLETKINKIATFLDSKGLKRFDRALLIFDNTIENVASFWACIKLGVIPAIIGPTKSGDVLSKTIEDLSPKVVFGKDSSLLSFVVKERIFIHSSDSMELIDNTNNYYHITTILQMELPLTNYRDVYGADLAAIIYTSGSTGYPKGVMLTHRNMLTALYSINEYLCYTSKDVILCILPLSFDYGLYQMLLSVLVMATLVIEENLIWIPSIFKIVDKYSITIFPLVSTVIPVLYKVFKDTYVTSTIRKITNTGVTLSAKHIDYLEKMFPGAEIFSMYGLTECKRCSYVPPEKLHEKYKSIGIPIPRLEMFVLSESGKLCAVNEHGQIVVRGEAVMQGYWNNPEETKNKFINGAWPGDKLLLTGDYGYVDAEGFFYLDGRADDLVKIRGCKVQLKLIEEVIREYPLVIDVSAFCYKDHTDTDQIVAAVILDGDNSNFEAEILNFCKTKLLTYEMPQKIYLLEDLPKNLNGKIDRSLVLQRCILNIQSWR